MKKTIKKCIAFLLCLHTVLFVVFQVFQVSSVVMAASDSYGQFVTSGEVQESQETLEETLESEETEESAEDASEETLESEESKESAEETLESEETEESAKETADESQESQEVVEETLEESESSSDISVIDEEETENEDEIQEGATLTWMSYADYRAAEAAKAWDNPELYVRQTAVFDLSLGYVYVSAGFDENTRSARTVPVSLGECVDASGESIQVVITDYTIDSAGGIWYKIEAEEGNTLPDILSQNPYVWHMDSASCPPALLMLPLKGMFVGETVYVQKEKVAASKGDLINVADVPEFFDVVWCMEELDENAEEGTIPLEFYDLGNVSDWTGITDPEYRYVSASSVILIPAEVSRAYETLMSVEDSSMYETILSYIPEEVKAQFTSKHKANLEEHIQYLHVIENVEKTANVTIGGVEIPVTVHGKIPMDATLSVEAITSDTVMAEGFDIKDASEIVTALDIKIDVNGVEWQPEEGQRIWVFIGMAEFGYADGSILKLQHKHGDRIDTYDIFVVLDGKVTVGIYGFSMFVVSRVGSTDQLTNAQGGQLVNNGATFNLEVGQEKIFYVNINNRNNYEAGTWTVTDTSGAIYYTVHSDSSATNGAIDNNGIYAPWIRICALKETTAETQITLRFDYADINLNWPASVISRNSETYTLNIVPPKAEATTDANKYKLYIKDTVNTTGTITATLVDKDGKEVTTDELDGTISCSWVRSDNAHIIPQAYKNDGRSIDICRDHAGLLQNRLTNVTYTVTATLPNGRQQEASYTVYYQSEIMNAGFETPGNIPVRNYTFLTNGWPDLFWKTTSPGTDANLSRDIELAKYNNMQNGNFNTNVTFYPNQPDSGTQIAEINAENFGALYQDIITAPGEEVAWEFSHAKRNSEVNGEAMFIVLGPTEYAQKVMTYNQLRSLIEQIIMGAKYTRDSAIAYLSTVKPNGELNSIRYTDPSTNAVYEIWYHNADDGATNTQNNAWTKLKGSYLVPDNQYRTRLFFVSDPAASDKGEEENYGNLIDSARGGQYRDYLIEYYEEKYVYENNSTVLVRELVQTKKNSAEKTDELGTAIMYSSVQLKNYDYFEKEENDILSTVFINGKNSPYNIKYLNYPCLFIENYTRVTDDTYPKNVISCLDDTVKKPDGYYDQFDIVMQVCFRDTMIAVQKWVEFPKVDGKEALSAIQKQNLIDELKEEGNEGYQADFYLDCLNENESGHFANSHISITKNDPQGWYTGYIPMGDNPNGSHVFRLTEEAVSPLTGLEIDTVEFEYFTFHYGERKSAKKATYTNVAIETQTVEGQTIQRLVATVGGVKQDVSIEGIDLNKADEYKKIAEVKVTNTYKEKQVKYNYVAVGKGKIAVQDTDKTLTTSDSETFAYYSGKPLGVKAEADTNYTFAGWYLDEDCTRPVYENYGYVDADGGFFPNKAKTVSDNVLEVTYYAKFSIGSLRIIRENAEPGQVFVYEVKDANGNTMYVTVVIGEDGTGTTEIVNASFGDNNEGLDYTVTQLNDWSWRYKDENEVGKQSISITQTHKETEGLHGAQNMTTVFRFPVEQKGEKPYWLNGNSAVKENIYGGAN